MEQTGIYYTKMSNWTFSRKYEANNMKVTKTINSNDIVTIMVCNAASGGKVPLVMVGKSKDPDCFYLCYNGT